ncbi:N-acetylglucosamine-6-phosphate deacetylase [Pseudobacter ginsenosidimutans]|jgi:N-acetylglucosamine-6-phosphate deacetylase|uniref:N-acetylglucosamine 6-phosphate deacetylase n=1 Tax=Pseudobacter ginsenosidimutans TaxID=661488 RepID=A0A4Q7N3H7_9BACT|nr:N-acetylglucosamine-6-phosphate deacetylase [Pseudobacter ginsenosidimutans]QEC44035.1 N-acetylglucosamine-6-phosphate deacetylase [Pseudobacter ginsenosidimutans]RZS75475.1 N-acetylglucosamine 6-phosphate deacetylase [Pseudobacter ginsenosidimutans]
MITAINNATIYTGEQVLQGQSLLIGNGRILDVVSNDAVPADATVTDASGHLLNAGFIDLQIYGAGGYLFSNAPSPAALQAVTNAIVRSGTTTYMLTFATNEMDIYLKSFEIVQQHPHPALAGIHLEGPYFNPVKRGAHIAHLIRNPTVQEINSLLSAAGGTLKMMTLAPEVTNDEVLRLLNDHGVIISAGHSNATFSKAMHGFANGIRTVTHLFNAMSPLHHRDTGLPGAAFLSDHAYASIIPDGVHVDWQAFRVAKQMMGRRLFFITDAVQEVLQGPYMHVRKSDRYTLPDGTLSGSCITMVEGVRNAVKFGSVSLEEALRMASLYPAEVMGATDIGRIQKGARANLVMLNEELELKKVWLEGREIA